MELLSSQYEALKALLLFDDFGVTVATYLQFFVRTVRAPVRTCGHVRGLVELVPTVQYCTNESLAIKIAQIK